MHQAQVALERPIFTALTAKQAQPASSGETVRAAGCGTPISSKHDPQIKPRTDDDVIQCDPGVTSDLFHFEAELGLIFIQAVVFVDRSSTRLFGQNKKTSRLARENDMSAPV
jgi:hypothetical protein